MAEPIQYCKVKKYINNNNKKENTDQKKKKKKERKKLTITTETSIRQICYPVAVALKIRNVEFFKKYRALTR